MSDRFVLGAPLGAWQTNCYLVGDRDRGTGVVIDPGQDGEARVPELLATAGVRCEAILLTHGHLDHVWAVPELARSLDVPVLLHPADRWMWDDPAAGLGLPPGVLEQQFGLQWNPPSERLVDVVDGGRLTPAGLDLRVRHNPGHTPGHVTYLAVGFGAVPITFALGDHDTAPDQVLFSGDLLFAGSIGRSDLPGGSAPEIMRSLATTVLPLEDDTLVLAGHGPDTTVGRERASNPFLAEAASGR